MAAVDRISEVPEPILHHILSFLTQNQAIQTSVLSRTWRHVGPTCPKIELRESCFRKPSRASFLSVFSKTLQRYHERNLSVHEFILEMSSSESDDQVIDSQFSNDPGKTSLFKGLKRLSLNNVHIKNEATWEKIMRSCPLIESISIAHCPNWYGHDKYFFPRLKRLCLQRVKLSAELFESFSSNFPSLEDLQLEYCYGLQEIKLTACSIKCLVLIADSLKPIRANIYAPNIHYFKFSVRYPPKLIFYSGTNREWKSLVEIRYVNCSDNKDLNLPWLLQLSELLNSLRESQISLEVFPNPFVNLKVEDAVFCKPVPLEHINVKGGYDSSSFPDLLNCLFLICRPRYICMHLFTITASTDLKRELAEFMTFKTIQNKGEMISRAYLWERDLEEISMQVCDANSQGWHTVGVEGTNFPGFTRGYPKIRFQVKWRD